MANVNTIGFSITAHELDVLCDASDKSKEKEGVIYLWFNRTHLRIESGDFTRGGYCTIVSKIIDGGYTRIAELVDDQYKTSEVSNDSITTRADLELNPEYKLVQVALTRGYTSRKAENMNKAPAVPYKGRYGTGYTTLFPNFRSSQYCYKEYWIKKED